jgi:hypothetical protein
MSKFTVKVKLQGLEIEVEGTREDAPKIASALGKQIGGLLQAPAALASGNGAPTIDAEAIEANSGAGQRRKTKRTGAGGGARTSADEINFVPDPQYGVPQQDWTMAQKAIWFLYLTEKQINVTQLTAYSIAKNFTKYFKVSGAIDSGNVSKGLEKERVKSPPTVGADQTGGSTKYFLVQAGKALAGKLAKGEAVSSD